MSGSPSSPAVSIDSSTATIKNSQEYGGELTVSDSQSYDQNASSGNEVAFDTAPLPSSLSISDLQSSDQNTSPGDGVGFDAAPLPSSLSRQQQADIKPTWSDTLDETRIPACARWDPNQNIEYILLDIHWAEEFAFIKLYKRLLLKNEPGVSGRRRRMAYIFFDLERIQRLLFTASPNIIPFGAHTIALTFYFNRPPALILPKTATGFAEIERSTRNSLDSLVQQSCFTIYAHLPQTRISHTRLQQFCNDITEHKFTSIQRFTNWKTLYQGSKDEAEMIEGDSLLEPAIDPDAAAPRLPAYQEIDLPAAHPTKRKRPYDESSAIGQTAHDTIIVQALDNILDAKYAAHQRRLEEMYSSYKREVEEAKRGLTETKRELTETKRELTETKRELTELKCQLKNVISKEEAEELKNDLMNRMDGIDKSIRDMPDTVEESILDTLCSTPFYPAR